MGEESYGQKSQAEPHLRVGLLDGEDSKEGRIVDWLGRPASEKGLGGWGSALLVVGVTNLCGIAYSGITSNLVVYLVDVWKQTNATAATNYTNLTGTSNLTSLLGAFLAEAYLGRLWNSMLFQVLLFLGSALVSWAATLQEHQSNPSNALQTFLFISLYLVALGNGSYRVTLITFAADQFDSPEAQARIFNIYFTTEYIGQVFCMTVLTYLENSGMWSLGFWISTAAVGIGTLLFVVIAPKCRQYRVGGNPVVRVVQVFVAAIRKVRVKVSREDTNMLYELSGEKSTIPGSRKISHTEKFRWLDKAARITDEDFVKGPSSTSPWQLCTVTQVEEVKCLGRTLPVWLLGIFFAAVIVQGVTLFVEQGQTMDRRLGGHSFKIPSVSLQLFSMFSSVGCAAVYDFLLVPFLRGRKGIISLQRIGCGLFAIVLTMAVAGLVEWKRLDVARLYGLINDPVTPVPLSVFWLVPQYVLLGIAENCVTVGYMNFFYGELSDGMKSFGSCVSFTIVALGSFVSSILVTVLTSITTRNGSPGWIPKVLNQGHVDYFYWLLSAMSVLGFIVFLMVARKYEYLEVENGD